MRRRQMFLERAELRRTLNTEQAEAPVPTQGEPAPALDKPKRGRPRKVKDDDAS